MLSSFLEKTFLNQRDKVEDWLAQQWGKTPAPFYASIDLRNSGFKLAPVDANLFPAGFNNLNPDLLPLCAQAARVSLQKLFPEAQEILLIPESHTRNPFYLENLAVLYDILIQAGFKARIASLRTDLAAPESLSLPSGHHLTFIPLQQIEIGNALLLLNNDLSGGIPEILKEKTSAASSRDSDLKATCPPLNMSWTFRLKSTHFGHYQAVTAEFADYISIDPWLITPLFDHCGEVDFIKREGEECLAHNTNLLIKAIQQKYDEYGVKEKPFVVVKADSGTYGMAVMMVHDAEELLHLNRKKRAHMSTIKGGQTVSQVILQEGVHTVEKYNNANAEPVIYLFGSEVVGGFYRVHPDRGDDDNLNSPGMYFEPLTPTKDHFYIYSIIARLATLACARECS